MKVLHTVSCVLQLATLLVAPCHGFGCSKLPPTSTASTRSSSTWLAESFSGDISRRDWGMRTLSTLASGLLPVAVAGSNGAASAVDVSGVAVDAAPIEMKSFVDPKGLFSITVPKRFFSLRRTEKGDLPDEKTGKGRRGSSIYTAGDMGKAEIIAVERFPTRVLLEENGIEATGDLSTFPALGESLAVATLINKRRERDTPSLANSVIFPDSVRLSDDKKELRFTIKTEIDVQKPELLMETYGVNQLFRMTMAKATLRSNDGNIMAVFSSALEQDFKGREGEALQEAIDSFQVTDQSAKQ